jgi:hypothetical protein
MSVDITLVRFDSDRRVVRAILFVGADDVLVYVYSLFHGSCLSLENDRARLGPISAPVNMFYFARLFFQPAGRTA